MKRKVSLLTAILLLFLVFNIKSQETSNSNSKGINSDAVVGTLPGNFAVSPTGAAIYSIPIGLPEGRAGMTPTLSFNYNSQAGNGLLGIGWSIGGLSAISRTGTTLYHDEVVSGVDFTDDDKIVLDGQRLIVINSLPNETEYRTEVETYSKIIGYGTAGSGHEYYKVWTKSGQVIEFGNTEDSRIQALDKDNNQRADVLTWNINNITDRQGNNIEFVYTESNGKGRIYQIKYGGNDKTNDSYEYVVFFNFPFLEFRNDKFSHFVSGSRIRYIQILDNINIRSKSNVLLKTYKLNYSEEVYTHLESIKLFAGNENTPFLNETIFEWGNNDHQKSEESHFWDSTDLDQFFIDINGDGKSDMIEAHWDLVTYNNGVTSKTYDQWHYKLRDNSSFTSPVPFENQISQFFGYLLMGDYNGDGLQDMLRASYTHELHDYMRIDMVLFSNGSGFDEHIIELEDMNEIPSEWMPEVKIGDFDGNGRDELLISYKDRDLTQNNTYIWQFEENDPYNTLVFERKMYYGTTEKDKASLVTGDFNGDGRTDLLRTAKYVIGGYDLYDCDIIEINLHANSFSNLIIDLDYPNIYHRIFTGDFNGDRITDILTFDYENGTGWKVNCFNGKDSWEYFGSPIFNYFDPYDNTDQHHHGVHIADFNGDGKSDIAEFEKETITQYYADYIIHYSKGDNWDYSNPATGQITILGGLNFFGGNYSVAKEFYQGHNMDFNGDGRMDIYRSNNLEVDKIYLFDIYNNYNSLLSITNGFGNKVEISYKPLTDENVYTKGSGSEFPIIDIQVPLYVVNSVTPDEELGSNLETTYKYSGARIHKQGKGFLGFSQVIATSKLSSTRTITDYELFTKTINNKELYFMPYPKTVTQYSLFENTTTQNKMLSKTSIEMDVIRTQSASDLVYYPVTTSTLNHSWDNDTDHTYVSTTKTVQKTYHVDSYGNSYKSQVATDENEYEESIPLDDYEYVTTINRSYTENIDIDNWLISRPDWTKITIHERSSGNEDYIVKKEYDYYDDPNEVGFGLPRSITSLTIPENSNNNGYYHLFDTKTAFVYNDYGNVIYKTFSAPNSLTALEDIVTEYHYDASDQYNSGYAHRFLTRVITSSPGDDYVKQFVYDPVTGNVEKEISPSGLITDFEYDGFGKLVKTIFADETFVENSFKWITDPGSSVLFYSEQIDQNNALTQVFYDKFERERKTRFPHYWAYMTSYTNYDRKGRVKEVSRPRLHELPAEQWTTYTYDALSKPLVKTLTSGNYYTSSYKGRTSSSTDNNTSIIKTKIVDALGRTTEVIDPTGSVIYNYYSDGNLKTVTANGVTTSMAYDPAGNQIELDEPNAGVNAYTYDAYGRLTDQVDGKGNHYNMSYDIMGRVTDKRLLSGVFENTTYTYNDNITINGFGKLVETSLTGVVYSYNYDQFGRVRGKKESFQGNDYSSSYTYDRDGNIRTFSYPSGFTVEYDYFSDGRLAGVVNTENSEPLWSVQAISYNGELQIYSNGNGLNTFKEFDDFGFISKITTDNIQNLEYNFDPYTGNLNWRKDNVFNLEESFTYDALLKTRLESWEVTGLENNVALYRNDGNIDQKWDVHDSRGGSYTYGNAAGPHALTGIDKPLPNYLEQATDQTIQYTAFNKTNRIDQFVRDVESEADSYNYTYVIEYGPDQARKISCLFKDHAVHSYKHYVGNYEVEFDAKGNKRELHYISGGDGVFAVYVKTDKENKMYYVHKDYLGSLYCITDTYGEVAEFSGHQQYYSFDPWGRRRNPFDWTFNRVPNKNERLFDRGFTGHEHLDLFGLINMNGRTYDPWLGRMLQPDNYVQAGGYSQNYNRYSYAYNNPLRYTDPDGEWVQLVIGAVIGGTINWATHGGEFTWNGLKYFGIGAVAGTLAAGVGVGVGAAIAGNAAAGGGFLAGFAGTATISSTGFAAGAISGAAAGVTNGLVIGTGNGMMSGQNFGDAFMKGGLDQAWKQGLAGGAIGGALGVVDALYHNEDWLTGSPYKETYITNGEKMLNIETYESKYTSDAVRRNYLKELPKSDEPYSITIKAPKGTKMKYIVAEKTINGEPLQYAYLPPQDNIATFNFFNGTPSGGAVGIGVTKTVRVDGGIFGFQLFNSSSREFGSLFWYLSLIK